MAQIRAAITACIIGFSGLSPSFSYGQNVDVACFAPYTAPAVVETVTEQILVQEENRGIDPLTGKSVIISPAIYRTDTVQRIVRGRQQSQIEIVCSDDQTINFIETLQRALTARGQYHGEITGQMDERTKRAVRKIQKSYGINIADVTKELAENYGLIIHRLFIQ